MSRHFTGEGGSDFQFTKNHRAGLSATPRCLRVVVEYGFRASHTGAKLDDLFGIFLEPRDAQGNFMQKEKPWGGLKTWIFRLVPWEVGGKLAGVSRSRNYGRSTEYHRPGLRL